MLCTIAEKDEEKEEDGITIPMPVTGSLTAPMKFQSTRNKKGIGAEVDSSEAVQATAEDMLSRSAKLQVRTYVLYAGNRFIS